MDLSWYYWWVLIFNDLKRWCIWRVLILATPVRKSEKEKTKGKGGGRNTKEEEKRGEKGGERPVTIDLLAEQTSMI